MEDKIDFKTIIKKLRKAAGLSQIELSKVIKKDQATVSRLEKGTQQPSLETIYIIGNFFGVKTEDLLLGHINYWAVSEKFDYALGIDPKYLNNKDSVLREVIPFMKLMIIKVGAEGLDEFLKEFGVSDLLAMGPDEKISSFIYFDLLDKALENSILSKEDIPTLIRFTESEEYHSNFYNIYKNHKDPFDVVKAYCLNSSQYEGCIKSSVVSEKENALTVDLSICNNLEDYDLKKNDLGNFLIGLKEELFGSLPKYFCNEDVIVKRFMENPNFFSSGINLKLIRTV